MRILAIETSCDETAIAVLECAGKAESPNYNILSNIVSSQIKIHAKWGGVVPNLAKREHENNLILVLKRALKQADLLNSAKNKTTYSENIISIFEKEPELLKKFSGFVPTIQVPKIDAIAVTAGPGLEPALWTGINFARALALTWKKPIIKINHMEGHIVASLLKTKGVKVRSKIQKPTIQYPALALLVSGGHTELVFIKKPLSYKIIGQTRDDAAGEAFDKAAKLLGLGYPGGPAISALSRKSSVGSQKIELPRPMIGSVDLDFSFSGLKTALLYKMRELKTLTPKLKVAFATEFQQAVIDVLVSKTIRATKKYKPKTVILGGGVSANKELRKQLEEAVKNNLPDSEFLIPELRFTGDNAAMIAAAGYLKFLTYGYTKNLKNLKAEGSLEL